MKRTLPTITAALALSVTSAVAADLPLRKAPPVYVPPPPPILWTGFYGGLNLGGGWSANNNNNNEVLPFTDPGFPLASQQAWPGVGLFPNLLFLPGNNNSSGSNGGVIGGGQVGYNYQFGTSIVIGVEADIQGTSISSNNNGNNLVAYPSPFAGGSGILVPLAAGVGTASVPWFGTVRGRAGWLITPTLLIYGTGGFAYGGVNWGGYTTTATGWTAGGGAEWMFLPNWSAKLEYLYVAATSSNYNNNQGWIAGSGFSNSGPALNVIRAGVNYHFNWAAPAPVVAKY